MSFTIVDDDDNILQIRATIGSAKELKELIEKLNRRLEDDFPKENSDEHDTGHESASAGLDAPNFAGTVSPRLTKRAAIAAGGEAQPKEGFIDRYFRRSI